MKKNSMLAKEIKAGGRRPVMPSPKIFTDKKKQAKKNACRVKEW